MSENKKYIIWLDVVRVLSIFGVLVIHVAAPIFNQWEPPFEGWLVANIYNAIARVSVPLLFMISGYLLLNRSETLSSFFFKRIHKVVVPLLVWSVIYLLWNNHGYANYTFFNAIKAVIYALLSKPASYHLWFMYALFSLYLFVPILRVFVRAADRNLLYYLAALWFFCGPLLNQFEQRILRVDVPLDLGFFTEYFGYFYLGYLLGQMRFSGRAALSAFIFHVLLIGYTVYATVTLTVREGRYNDFYLLYYVRLNLAVMSICAFIWLKHVGEAWQEKIGQTSAQILRHLSATSFGVYLVHVMILTMLKWGTFGFTLTPSFAPAVISIPLMTLAVYFISWLATAFLQRIPVLRSIVPA